MKKDPKKSLSLLSLNKEVHEANKETAKRFDSLEKNIVDTTNNLSDQVAQILKAVSAKDVPVNLSKDGKDVRDVYQKLDTQDIEFKENSNVHADVEVERANVTSVNTAEFKEKANQMRFDSEQVLIMVMPSSSTYPDHTFTIGVNGRMRLIMRGMKQWIPRNYVEVLLRAKISLYGNTEVRNHLNEIEVKHPETKAHRYPLQILQDNNPLGSRWLERVANDMTV